MSVFRWIPEETVVRWLLDGIWKRVTKLGNILEVTDSSFAVGQTACGSRLIYSTVIHNHCFKRLWRQVAEEYPPKRMREREMGWDRQKREEKGEGEGGKIRGACANMTQYKPSKEKWIFQVWKSQKENCGKLWAFYDICSIRCSSGVNPEATCVLQFDYCETKFRTVFWKCDFNFKAQQGHRVLLVIVLPTWHEVNCTKLKYFQESSEDHWAHCKSLGPHRASKYKTCREEFGV